MWILMLYSPQQLNSTMKNNTEMEIIDKVNTRDVNSREYTQKFQYHHEIIEHQNRLQIQRTQGTSEPLAIRNHFASIEGGKVIKITEVVLGDKIIKIVDELFLPEKEKVEKVLQVEAKKEEVKKPSRTRKNILDKKYKVVVNQDGEEEFKIRDTKNVVKNIFKLFQSWVDDQISSELKIQLKQSIEQLLKANKKFNNNLIIGLSKNQILRKAYLAFSETEGQNLIEYSRIQDKASHLEALHKYHNLCSNQDYSMDMERDVHNENSINHSSESLIEREGQVAE